MPQKQKFNASLFLDRKVIAISSAAVAIDEAGHGRISLGETSTLSAGAKFEQWDNFLHWDPAAAAERVQAHQAGPLDLEVDLQEEVVLTDWQIGEPIQRDKDGPWVYPVASDRLVFDAIVSKSVEGTALKAKLDEQRKKKRRPPLYGLMHYEKCRLMLQPLTLFGPDGPEYLTISSESIDRAALLKALKLT